MFEEPQSDDKHMSFLQYLVVSKGEDVTTRHLSVHGVLFSWAQAVGEAALRYDKCCEI